MIGAGLLHSDQSADNQDGQDGRQRNACKHSNDRERRQQSSAEGNLVPTDALLGALAAPRQARLRFEARGTDSLHAHNAAAGEGSSQDHQGLKRKSVVRRAFRRGCRGTGRPRRRRSEPAAGSGRSSAKCCSRATWKPNESGSECGRESWATSDLTLPAFLRLQRQIGLALAVAVCTCATERM